MTKQLDIAEGRRLLNAILGWPGSSWVNNPEDRRRLRSWLYRNAPALLDAAERTEKAEAALAHIRTENAELRETIKTLASPDPRPIWEQIAEIGRSVSAEEWDKLPHDLSVNLHHYLYGAPKEEVPGDD